LSRQHINAYRKQLAKLHAVSGGLNEGQIRKAFAGLLDKWGGSQDLTLSEEWPHVGPKGHSNRVDGALVPGVLRIPFGYWEAKDSKDNLDKEIKLKRDRGYPDDNIIYEDSTVAVLRQNGQEVDRAAMDDDDALLKLLTRFFAFERPEISEFRKAAAQFRADLPQILGALREALGEAEANNAGYATARAAFLEHAKSAINPSVTADDVREMLIQHILTEEIFTSVFDQANYHRENNVAQRLTELEGKFFTGALRHATTQRLLPYYNAIKHAATGIADRREKQTFLKKLYEDFYKVYNPKAADRLGVVYTPGEIVRFMIRGADWLCEKHFGKCLVDPGVEILDPATGTGTFIVELLEHFAGAGADKLRHKYTEELHANEVAILPYYVANLNIEATYAAISGQYAEFPGLVFVDTLDNTAGLGKFAGYSPDLFGSLSDENLGRIKRQNERKISVIIGNPPYNAWQENYNGRNPNRPYKRIDERIAATYRALSTAQNTSSLSDMYVRFYRWVSDRLRDDGIVAFVTNRNFIDKIAFDGFRKAVAKEFAEIWLIDLGGDVRANPKISGTKHNAMGIQTGLTIAFMVRAKGKRGPAVIRYARRPEEETASDKRGWLSSVEGLSAIQFSKIRPSDRGVWLDQSVNEWSSLLSLADPTAVSGDAKRLQPAIFRLSSNGLKTQRDDWVWDSDERRLTVKTRLLINAYEKTRKQPDAARVTIIKWDRELERYLKKGVRKSFDRSKLFFGQFRPFVRRWVYFDQHFNGMTYRIPSLFRAAQSNQTIAFLGMASSNEFSVQATDRLFDLGYLKAGNGGTQGVTRYRYIASGERVDNITDWALVQFRTRYAAEAADLTKDDIFAYVYAVLHDPVYRTTYAADLRREFPRIPLYDGFARWAAWGRTLLDLHIGYETVDPAALTRVDVPSNKPPTPKLKSLPDTGVIVLDSVTQLTGVPRAAWDYRLGNRSAIDWVLDQHKEKKIKDPTVARLFDTYRFADHKERVVDLLARVVTVSVRTVAITEAMRGVARGQ